MTTLFRHYLIAASRNLVKHKLYSFINIVGLSVGLACAIFITLFLWLWPAIAIAANTAPATPPEEATPQYNTAILQGLNKVTGHILKLEVPVGTSMSQPSAPSSPRPRRRTPAR